MATDELPLGETGLASALRFWYFNAANQVYNDATDSFEAWADGSYADYQVSGVSEIGTTGSYQITTPAAVANESTYRFEVHRVVGGTPSTDPLYGEGEDEGTGATAQDPVTLPETRLLTFEYRTGDPATLTDVTGTPLLSDPTGTFGAKRLDTGATVVADATPMTHDGTGLYSYEVTENGYALEYWVEFVVGGATRRQKFYSNPPATGYTTDGLVEAKLGTTNARIWADMENNEEPAVIAAMLADARRQAVNRVNLKLMAAGVTLPFTSPGTHVSDLVQDAATDYAAGYLIKKREDQSRDNSNPNTQTPGDALIAEGDEILDVLIESGALTEDETDDDASGSFEFVDIQRTGPCASDTDENARPIYWW